MVLSAALSRMRLMLSAARPAEVEGRSTED
jgi:hypothetical protein